MRRTRAILVGIERYAAGKDWDLDGPAMDVCRMVQWLQNQGVPREQMTLLIAPLPSNMDAVTRLGMPVSTPDRHTIGDLVTNDLRMDTSDLLLLFWGGHGVVDGHGNRRLFYADATIADKRNLDFNSLMAALGTTYFAALGQQILVVDACQNLTEELRYVNSLPKEEFSRGSHSYGKEQHALFAASAGERAVNVDVRREGLFSAEVLSYLEREPGWPPDVVALARSMDERFTKLRASGATLQTPTYLWCRSKGYEGLVYSLPRSVTAERLSPDALLELMPHLLDVDEIVHPLNRQGMIMLMPQDIRVAVPYSENSQLHIVQWIRACEQFSTGRAAFVGALRLGVANRQKLERLMLMLDRLWPERMA